MVRSTVIICCWTFPEPFTISAMGFPFGSREIPCCGIERLQAFGVNEIVVKNGPNSALVAAAGARDAVPVPEVVVPVDPTAAGDGFNAGYLAARLSGHSAVEAAQAAHRLAGQVIQHRGAITPRAGAAVH